MTRPSSAVKRPYRETRSARAHHRPATKGLSRRPDTPIATTEGRRPRRLERPVGPDQGPVLLPRRAWLDATKRAIREFSADAAIPDWAAALTTPPTGERLAPGQVGEFLNQTIDQVRDNAGAAGLVAILGLLVAFWSASGYIGAFMRASNAIYDVPEGRPVWRTIPTRLALTAGVGILLIASALIVVFTGPLAEQAGKLIGVGPTAVTVWAIAKWPVLLILVSLMFSLLYWLAPNARQGGWRWITVGGLVAVLAWLIISGLSASTWLSRPKKTWVVRPSRRRRFRSRRLRPNRPLVVLPAGLRTVRTSRSGIVGQSCVCRLRIG